MAITLFGSTSNVTVVGAVSVTVSSPVATPADAFAAPGNVVQVQAFPQIWNGTTWDRLRGSGASGPGAVLAAIGGTNLGDGQQAISVRGADGANYPLMQVVYNGTSWDRLHGTNGRAETFNPQIRTYSASFNFAGVAGDCVEIVGPTAGVARITEIVLSSTVAQNFQIVKRSAHDTGGTSATPTVVTYATGDAAATVVVKTYTVAPAQGASLGAITQLPIASSGTFEDAPGTRNTRAIQLASTESLALVIDASGTIQGRVEWTEASA